jgi:membrane-bound lytic murein transglycosylase A
MSTQGPREVLAGAVLVLALAACETPSRPPSSAALPPPLTGPSEPAPIPSEAADDYVAAQAARRQGVPSGPDAMPGFGASPRVGTDMIMAPMPAERIRQQQPLPR